MCHLMGGRWLGLLSLLAWSWGSTHAAQGGGDDLARSLDKLRLNQIQVIGTHNSYHLAPEPASMEAMAKVVGVERIKGWDYTHRPLPEQFIRLGIRQIELDVFADPAGGLFANPLSRVLLGAAGVNPQGDAPGSPNADDADKAAEALRLPGFKVLHVQDLDHRSTVTTLEQALAQVRGWSRDHPRHVPILILLELKDQTIAGLPTRPIRFDEPLLDQIDAALRQHFPPGTILTPDDLRGHFADLPTALTMRGWPTLAQARGKVLAALDNEGSLRDLYVKGHPALKGRMMFVSADGPESPEAAWFKINDPVGQFDRIQNLVRAGFLVRTRADAETREARTGDISRRDRALASGAQFISTDYPEARVEWSPYQVRLPGGIVARPNPVSAADFPGDLDVEGSLVGSPSPSAPPTGSPPR